MKLNKMFSMLAIVFLFCTACSEDDDNTNGNENLNGKCKCSDATCENCPLNTVTCSDNFITTAKGVEGYWNGKLVVRSSKETKMCKNGCVQLSETNAECRTAEE